MAELQFSGSRRDLAVEEGWVQPLCWLGESVCVCVYVYVLGGGEGGGVCVGGALMEKGKNSEKKGKEESHELSLKMNEKMGNPKVTA